MRAIVGIICAAALAGCATTGSGTGANAGRTGQYADWLGLSTQAQKVLKPGEQLPDRSPNDAVLIFMAQQTKDEVARERAVQEATARALIMNSDTHCEVYMSDFLLKARSTTAVMSVAGLALSGAAGVTTPVRSANILSALSTFANGSQDRLNKAILSDRAPELLYKAVMAERSRERARLLALLVSKDLGAKAPGVVLAQIADYHARCGPTVGINSLTDSVLGAANSADADGTAAATAFVNGALKKPGS